ncbi:MAG: hypothetical protein JOZ22_24615, partial [Acidobacteriia bacterium]|nr:hypothetical protein [Terriglobia bacterium]
RLTVNIGLRFDRQNLFSLQDSGPNGITFPAKNYIAFHDLGPRVGASYDLSGPGAGVLKIYNNLIDIAGLVNAGRPLSAYMTPVTFYVPKAADVATASSPAVTLWNLSPALTGPSVQVFGQHVGTKALVGLKYQF